MNDKFQSIWKDSVMSLSRYYSSSFLGWAKEYHENPINIPGYLAEIRSASPMQA
jgi:hypothetical protein